LLFGLLARLLAHNRLDCTPFLVEAVEFGGDGAGFLGVGRGQQADAEVGLADAAPSVDPRAEREAEVAARLSSSCGRRNRVFGSSDPTGRPEGATSR